MIRVLTVLSYTMYKYHITSVGKFNFSHILDHIHVLNKIMISYLGQIDPKFQSQISVWGLMCTFLQAYSLSVSQKKKKWMSFSRSVSYLQKMVFFFQKPYPYLPRLTLNKRYTTWVIPYPIFSQEIPIHIFSGSNQTKKYSTLVLPDPNFFQQIPIDIVSGSYQR